MNNTYFSPITSEIKFDGMVMQSATPAGDPTNPVDPKDGDFAPARKLYV